MENGALYGIIGVIVTGVLAYLSKGSSKKVVRSEDGRYHLRLHSLYWYVGMPSTILGVVLFILPTIYVEEAGWMIGLVFLVIFCGCGIPCAILYKNHKVAFDDKIIESGYMTSRKSAIEWKSITKVSFSPFSGMVTLASNDSTQVKLHMHLVGLDEFVKMLEQQTKWKAKDLKLPKF